jgi:predicted PurR-regulated permease PerM
VFDHFRQTKPQENPPSIEDVLSNRTVGIAAQILLAVAVLLAICYFAKLVMITLVTSILLAFVLAPLVDMLKRWRIPRSVGSFLAVALLLACVYGVMFFSYNQARNFIRDLPKYSDKIGQTTIRFRQQAEQIQKTTESVLPDTTSDERTLKVQPKPNVSDWVTNSAASLTELLLFVSFIPFLIYFMLSWMERMRIATVSLFRQENREAVNRMLGGIASMFRAFIVGNLICGLFMGIVSVIAFGALGLPYFYFLGFISAFLSLIPYLGVVLAMLPPIAAGLESLNGSKLLWIAVITVGVHVFAINVLFPKIIGRRLNLNPLVVTIALLIWGWMWGAMGLILAVPITGALKIIFDHVHSLKPLGAWMGE